MHGWIIVIQLKHVRLLLSDFIFPRQFLAFLARIFDSTVEDKLKDGFLFRHVKPPSVYTLAICALIPVHSV